jgi:hypothetical protein
MARPALALGGIVLIGVGVALAFGWWSSSTAEADAQMAAPIRSVRLEGRSGDVAVRAGDVPVTTVHQRFRYRGSRPGDAYAVEGDRLVLRECGWNCTVDYEVIVPRAATVSGHVGSGDIILDGVAAADVSVNSGDMTIREVPGTVRAQAGSGDLILSGVGQEVSARSSSGDIRGDRLRGRVTARADSGDIELHLDAVQDVTAGADSGSVRLTVPPERYRVQGQSNSGARDIRVVQDPAAARLLDVTTSSGDVSVRAA